MSNISTPKEYKFQKKINNCELLILASGFEERAFSFLSKSKFPKNSYCLLLKFESDLPENKEIYDKYIKEIKKSFDKDNILEVCLNPSEPQKYENNLRSILFKLPSSILEAWIDISGMPTHAICSTLNTVRNIYPNRKQTIIYTAATKYYPTIEDYEELKKMQSKGIEFLPKSMALEMSEVLYLKSFSGYRSKDGSSCLAVFAGYDVHRSSGVIGSINPSMLLMLYGKPGDDSFKWRLDLSKQLHKGIEKTRKTASENVSTLNPNDSIQVLENYYEYLYEDYDLTVSPVCSKMQAVGTYLFWERYKEIQLVFPLPIGYSIEHAPKGVGQTYKTTLDTRNSFYHTEQ